VETPVAVVEAALAEAPAAEVKEFAVEGRSEIEIRAQHLAPTTEVAAIAEPTPVEVEQSGVEPAATQAAASPLAEKQLQETQATENRPSEKTRSGSGNGERRAVCGGAGMRGPKR